MATSVIKPANAGIDLPISLPTSGWSSNQWTYSNSAITADCAIEVEFKAGTLNTNVPYIEYDKVSGGGGIVFTVPSVPTVAIPVIAHVYYTQAGAFTSTDATLIETKSSGAQALGANVDAALSRLNSNIATFSISVPTSGTKLYKNAMFKRIGSLIACVTINGLDGLANGTTNTVLAIPSGFVPLASQEVVVVSVVSGERYKLNFSSNGNLEVYPYSGVSDQHNIIVSFTYPLS